MSVLLPWLCLKVKRFERVLASSRIMYCCREQVVCARVVWSGEVSGDAREHCVRCVGSASVAEFNVVDMGGWHGHHVLLLFFSCSPGYK